GCALGHAASLARVTYARTRTPGRPAAALAPHLPGAARLRREIEAQLAAFAATGLRLAHLDGHLNMHLHPMVLPILRELAPRYDIRAMRLSREGGVLRARSAPRRVQRLRLLRLRQNHRGRRRSDGRYRPQRHHPPVAMDAQHLPAPAHLVAEERAGPHERVEEVLRGDEPEPAERVVLAEEPEHADQPHQAAPERPCERRPAEEAPAGHGERQAAP